jgi:hypothetical protein
MTRLVNGGASSYGGNLMIDWLTRSDAPVRNPDKSHIERSNHAPSLDIKWPHGIRSILSAGDAQGEAFTETEVFA